MSKKRADLLLVEKGLAESRARAQALILAGLVYGGTHQERRIQKSGELLAADYPLTVKGLDHPWVSRGGIKLAHAIEEFGISCRDKICLDLGASTGGFTDVLLQNGAAKIYAVDVGYGQLAWKIRQDARVVTLEKTNARFLTSEIIPQSPDLIVCDASFIGLRTLLPASLKLAHEGTELLALIKPQFEAGRKHIGSKGVVSDPQVHKEVCAMISDWINGQKGWRAEGLSASPITGPEGNREFLLYARFTPSSLAAEGQPA